MPMDDADSVWDFDGSESGRWEPSDADVEAFERWTGRRGPARFGDPSRVPGEAVVRWSEVERESVFQRSRPRSPEDAIRAMHTIRRAWEKDPTEGVELFGANGDNEWAVTRWPNPDYL